MRMLENLLFIRALLAHLDRLQDLLGETWPNFQRQLQERLLELLDADDDEQALKIVDRILELGVQSPAGELVISLLQQAVEKAGGPARTTRSVTMQDPTSGQERPVAADFAVPETVDESAPAQPVLPVKGRRPVPPARTQVVAAGQALEAALRPRYLQSTFHSDHPAETMTTDTPLALEGGPYTLEVFIGPGEGETPFPDQLLAQAFQAQGELALPVRVTSADLEITSLDDEDSLNLKQQGASTPVRFQVTPRSAGRARLNVDVFYRGNLLQRQQVDLAVVEQIGDPVPVSARPPQVRRIVYTIAGTLSREALARWEERVVHITAERSRDEDDGSYLLRFRRAGQDVFLHDSDQTDLSLAKLIPEARAELAAAADAYHNQPPPEAAQPLLARWLPLLAYQGTRLYEAMFWNAPENPLADLPAESVIQVSPIGQRATLPWGLVYDRPLLPNLQPDQAARRHILTNPLCPDWLAGHDCPRQGCPQAHDTTIVCPAGFWGYRYIIEQLPAGFGAKAIAEVSDLPHLIDNCAATHFSLNGFADFALWSDEVTAYQDYARRAVDPPFILAMADSLAAFSRTIQQALASGEGPHLIYFYAHGGVDSRLGTFLRLGRETTADYLTLSTFRGLKLVRGALRSRPLVFLNACQSADYTPDAYGSFIARFHEAGACGVVGTECSIWEQTARTVADGFFNRLFAGLPAGQALWQTSQDLLAGYNPLGLAYTLFASGLTRLACKV